MAKGDPVKRSQVALGMGLLVLGAWALFSISFRTGMIPLAGRQSAILPPGPRAWAGGQPGFGPGGMMPGRGMMSHGGASKTSFASNGEQIYYTGISGRTGAIAFQGGPMWLSMHGGSCVSCHGEQGQGGVPVMMLDKVPPDITYAHLTGAHHHEGGEMNHPPYTDELIKRAITKGINPAGERLSSNMPRWHMSERDLDDLLAYLKALGPAPEAAEGHSHETHDSHNHDTAAGSTHGAHDLQGGHGGHTGSASGNEKPAWSTLVAFLGLWGLIIGAGRYAWAAGYGKPRNAKTDRGE